MIKAIAFDLDNTLIDFWHFKRETAKAAAQAMVHAGLKAKPAAVADKIFDVYDEYGVEFEKTIGTVLWDKYHIRDYPFFEKVQQAGIVAYQKRSFEVMLPYKDVIPTLDKLKKHYKLFIISDAPRKKAWKRLHMSGLADYFDEVVTWDDTRVRKPSKLPFKTLFNLTGLKPSEVLFVGDMPDRDIKGAKKAGMKTAWAKYGYDEPYKLKEKPDLILKRFRDLLGTLV